MKEKKYRSLGTNAVLNTIKSGMSILFPLITYPYAFRVLHASGMGKVDYANSIIGYFSLVAALGIGSYAVREGSKVRENRLELEKFVSQIFTINFLSTIFSYVVLILCAFFIPKLESHCYLILLLGLSIGFTTLGVEWINSIFEDYLYITIRSIVTHIITLILLFIIVRDEKDFYNYAFLTVLTNAIICIMNWYRCRKYLTIKLTFNIDWKRHLKPIILLFANNIAISIYVSADITMLGIMAGDAAVGLYSIAVKIYSVVKKLLNAMFSVTIPRISFHWGQGEIDKVREIFTKLLSNLLIVLLPASVGLMCISKEVILFMGGEEYLDSVLTLQILSVALIGAILGGAVTCCLNIPIGLEKYNLMATVISAGLNIAINAVVLPIWRQNGAAFSTVISEFFVLIFCIVTNKRFAEFINKKMLMTNVSHAVIGCISIVVITFSVHNIVNNDFVAMVSIICLSGLAYLCELIALKNEIAMLFIKKIRGKLWKSDREKSINI